MECQKCEMPYEGGSASGNQQQDGTKR